MGILLIYGLLVALMLCICGILVHQNNQAARQHTAKTIEQLLQHTDRLMWWNDYLLKHWDDSLAKQMQEFTKIIEDMEPALSRAVGDAAAEVFDTVRGDRTMHMEVKGKPIAIKGGDDDPEATRRMPQKQEEV